MTMILDTRSVNKPKIFALILDDGTPEGRKVTFEVQPLTSDLYFKINEQQAKIKALTDKGSALTRRELQTLQKTVDDIVIPLVTPADEFKKYLDSATEVGRRMVLDNIAVLAFPKVRVDSQTE